MLGNMKLHHPPMRISMTSMNFENDRVKRQKRELSSDDLPSTGSWADRVRYLQENDLPRTNQYKPPKRANAQPIVQFNAELYSQLKAYVDHASHKDFWRKSASQRIEIIKALSTLHFKCVNSSPRASKDECILLRSAIELIRRGRFTH